MEDCVHNICVCANTINSMLYPVTYFAVIAIIAVFILKYMRAEKCNTTVSDVLIYMFVIAIIAVAIFASKYCYNTTITTFTMV